MRWIDNKGIKWKWKKGKKEDEPDLLPSTKNSTVLLYANEIVID